MNEQDKLSLLELQEMIRDGVESAVPDKVWVKAEVASIQAKSNGTTVSGLYLQPDGGVCNVNGKRIVRGTGGSSTKHVFVDGEGNITASNADVGGTAQGVYLSKGTITKMSGTVGGANQPPFLSGGVVKACNAYGTISMVPNYAANVWRAKNTTYTAGSNGFILVHGSSNVSIDNAQMHNTYWSYTSHQNKSIMYPVAKGQKYWTDTGCWWVPAK